MRRALAFLLFAAAAAPAPAQELGRLFFTQEQRAALDVRRRARVPDKGGAGRPAPRSGGGLGAARVAGRGGAAGAPRFSLKPGQVLDRGTGEVRDVLGPNGELQVSPAK